MGFNANQTEIIIESLVLLFLATIAVLARLYARRKVTPQWTADDYFSIASLTFFLGYNVVVVDAAVNGRTGVDPLTLSYPVLTVALKETMAATILMAFTITLARFSVVFMYHRLFSVDHRFARALYVLGGLSLAWMITVVCLMIFRCLPVEKQWNPLVAGSCLNLQTIFVVGESINCFLDVVLVSLPLFLIPSLKIQTREKAGLCLIFVCGGFVGVTSIVRIVNLYNPDDPAFAFTQSAFWTTIQLFFAIICACLPTYRPIFPTLSTRVRNVFSSFSSRSRSRSVNRSKGGQESLGVGVISSNAGSRQWYGHPSKPSHNVQIDQVGLTDIESNKDYSVTEYDDDLMDGKHTIVIKHCMDRV